MPEDPTRSPTEAEKLFALVEQGKIQIPHGYSSEPRGIVYHEHEGGEAWDPCNFDSYSCLDRQNGKLPEGERVDLTRVPLVISCDCVFADISVGGRGVNGYLTREQFEAYQRGELVVDPVEDDMHLIAALDAKRLWKDPYPIVVPAGG